MIGKQFGSWTVIELFGSNKHGKRVYLAVCVCECLGKVVAGDLRSGKSTQCVLCYNKLKGNNRRTHGKSTTNTYSVWQRMKERCLKTYSKDYKYYGARGITVCDRWLKYDNFLEDMGEKPEGLQIDRIDNNLGYYKENCRWVTPKQNSANRRAQGTAL